MPGATGPISNETSDAIDDVFDLNDSDSTQETGQQEQQEGADDGQQPEGDDQQQQQQQQTNGEQQDDADPDAKPLFSERPARGPKGEILDQNGKVIAATPREKEYLFELNRTRIKLNDAAGQVKKLMLETSKAKQEADDAKFIFGEAPQKMGLNNDEVFEAMRYRTMFKADPVTAIRNLVADVMQQGYTLDQLFSGADAVGYINQQMITGQLDKKLAPITQRFEQERKQTEQADAAQRQVEEFVSEHPHADTHGEAIARLVQERDLSPTKAYYELRSFADRNRLDFSKPLGPQIAARQNNGGKRQAPLPGNRTIAQPNGGVQPMKQQAAPVTSSTRYRDIVSQTMREIASRTRTQ